jgi:translocation and assembly module TamB
VAGSGHNFDPSQLKFDGWLRLFPSRLPAVLIDSAYCRLHTAGADLQLDTLRVVSPMGTVQAGGLMSLRYENNFRFRAELGDLAWVKRAMEADTLRAAGVITGQARGPFDSLAVAGRFEMQQIQYNLMAIKNLTGNLTFNRLPDPAKRGGLIKMKSSGLTAGYLPLDSATAVVHFDLERAQIESKFWQGVNNYGELNGLYTFGETGRFEVWRGMIKAFGQTWQTPADSAMSVEVGDEVYDFHRLSLASGNQRLHLDGRLSYLGAEDLRFKIEGVEIASLAALLSNEPSSSANGPAGILMLQGHLTGTAQAPILHGQAQWSNGRVSDFAFEKWAGEFGYENEKFSWQFTLQQNQDRRLTGDGYLPMNLSLHNDGAVLYRDRPIRMQVGTSQAGSTGIDLAFLETFVPGIKHMQGTLAFDVKLENTLRQPRSKGTVRIIDGAFALPRYGVSYNNLQLAASIDSAFVKVTDFQVRSDKGILKANGQLNFTRDAVTDANGSLTASDFLVARNRDMELRIDAKIVGTGNKQGAEYSGGINVKRSRFFLRNLQQGSVIQLDESTTPKKSPADSAAAAAPANPMQRWLDNLNGELKINIPRNTWIRGPEFNAEIEGALDFIQEGMNDFSLFGPLNIIRGTYELFGKRFDIDGGQITFLGDYQTPQLDLTARHSFRGGDREKKTLEVKISGSLASPQIQFLRDGEPVDERDALANLFFGLDFEQLLSGQREDVQEEASKAKDPLVSAAGGLLSGLVSQQLEKSFGRSLNLDLIQFEGGDNISVVVGKYLTNDVFISLSQEPEARVFSLEWELYKFFFLLLQGAQGEDAYKKTGIDFIWKKDW